MYRFSSIFSSALIYKRKIMVLLLNTCMYNQKNENLKHFLTNGPAKAGITLPLAPKRKRGFRNLN